MGSETNLPPSSAAPTRMLSLRKRWLFRFVLVVILIPVIELLSWLGLRVADSQFSFHAIFDTQNHIAVAGTADKDRPEILHPYMGWAINPQTHPDIDVQGRRMPINSLGFVDDGPTIRKRSSGRLVVGIAGGSVAQQMSVFGEETLRRRLGESDRLHGARIELVRLAFAGFKQPQQLMTLNYVLSLGGEFDVVVNIDGFNEIALPPCENGKLGVFAAYPRSWSTMTYDIVDPRHYSNSYALFELRGRRQQAAKSIAASWLRYSPTRNLIWKTYDAYLMRQANELAMRLTTEKEARGRGFLASGPPQFYENDATMFRHLADLWRNSSRQMDALCRANGIRYIHVLQPNLHIKGTRPPNAEPVRPPALGSNEPCYAIAVRKGHSLLIGEGEKLRAAGENFHDFTQFFATVPEPVYCDACCHFNQTGNDRLASGIADLILAALEPQHANPVAAGRQ